MPSSGATRPSPRPLLSWSSPPRPPLSWRSHSTSLTPSSERSPRASRSCSTPPGSLRPASSPSSTSSSRSPSSPSSLLFLSRSRSWSQLKHPFTGSSAELLAAMQLAFSTSTHASRGLPSSIRCSFSRQMLLCCPFCSWPSTWWTCFTCLRATPPSPSPPPASSSTPSCSPMVTCNLSIVISVTDGSGGHLSILKALVLVKGRTATAITLTLPASLGMAGIEALFQYRVIRPYRVAGTLHVSVIWEAFSIIYMHSLLVVLDTIITCTFLESCQSGIRSSWRKSDDAVDMESEPKFSLHV
ncbi:unnamed protein product [Musa acuminata subsp. malaccensis]|uniref:(wild Malaysian banana) hypothetical protein n=1 Tax=Musa acuminata subsp. malaccensis TaxID=214687 RepID=A0A804IE04_MUSAM|nr:unnamed protein product [Musa acuminata subsp. malaccensis]